MLPMAWQALMVPHMAWRASMVPPMDLSFIVAADGLAGFDGAADGSASFLDVVDGLAGFNGAADGSASFVDAVNGMAGFDGAVMDWLALLFLLMAWQALIVLPIACPALMVPLMALQALFKHDAMEVMEWLWMRWKVWMNYYCGFGNRRVDLEIHTNSYAYSHLGA